MSCAPPDQRYSEPWSRYRSRQRALTDVDTPEALEAVRAELEGIKRGDS